MISNLHFFCPSCECLVWDKQTAKVKQQHNISGAYVELKKHIVKILQESRKGATVTESHDFEATGKQELAVISPEWSVDIQWRRH